MLSPNPNLVQELLTNLYISHHSLNCAALALRNLHLYLPQDPKPNWYEEIDQNIRILQHPADDWLFNHGPQVIIGIPQEFIYYCDHFRIFARNAQHNNIDLLQHQLHWLRHRVSDLPQLASNYHQQIQPFISRFSEQKSALEQAIHAAEQTLSADRDKVEQLQSRIDSLYRKISSQTAHAHDEMTQVTSSGAAATFALLTYGFEVALAVGAQSFPLVGLGVALVGLTYSSIMNAIHQQEVIDELRQISQLKLQIQKESQEIAALQIIRSSLNKAEEAIETIRRDLSFQPVWQSELQKLADLNDQLSQPGIDPQQLESIRKLPVAVLAWERISAMSSNIQRASSGFSSSWQINLNHLEQTQ